MGANFAKITLYIVILDVVVATVFYLTFQAEVSQLEGSLEATDTPHFPPYLIPDTSCLCDSLHLVKQLTQSGKGILIIPISGEWSW